MSNDNTRAILENIFNRCRALEDIATERGFFNASVKMTLNDYGTPIRFSAYMTPRDRFQDSLTTGFDVDGEETVWTVLYKIHQWINAQKSPADLQKEGFALRLARLLEEGREHGYDAVVPTLESLFETFKSDYHIEDKSYAAE